MQWHYRFIPQAEDDMRVLDGSQRKMVFKVLDKLMTNPLPADKGGYGKRLGHVGSTNLTGLMKIKLRGAGLRIVHDLIEIDGVAYVVVVGAREDSEVYEEASKRMDSYKEWLRTNRESR